MNQSSGRKRGRQLIRLAASLGATFSVVGCGIGSEPPPPLSPDAFVQRKGTPPSPNGPLDKGSAPLYDSVHYNLIPADSSPPDTGEPRAPISKTVRDLVRPLDVTTTQPVVSAPGGTSPATRPLGGPSIGNNWLVGSVLAEVNGTAIYADKVLASLEQALQAEARHDDPERFRTVAEELIRRQVGVFIHDELEFARAQHSLDSKDELLAREETANWRQRQIAQAGGSVEVARRKAAENGQDFDEQCRQHYRAIMNQLYYQRKVYPLIDFSARDVRNYYDENKDSEFTQPDKAKFRVIKINVTATGGRQAALAKIQEIAARIKAGADFATIAGQINDDRALLEHHGDVYPGGWMERNAFRVEKVEKAVWAVQPGEVTDIIDDDNDFYLAKLEQRKDGKVEPFWEQSVQDKIRATLRARQFQTLREMGNADLERKAAITTNPRMMETALEMVMQRYPRWTGVAIE